MFSDAWRVTWFGTRHRHLRCALPCLPCLPCPTSPVLALSARQPLARLHASPCSLSHSLTQPHVPVRRCTGSSVISIPASPDAFSTTTVTPASGLIIATLVASATLAATAEPIAAIALDAAALDAAITVKSPPPCLSPPPPAPLPSPMEMPPTPFPPRPLHPPRLQLRPPPPPPQLLTLPPPLSDPFSPAPVASATLSVSSPTHPF